MNDKRFYVYIYLDPFEESSLRYCENIFINKPIYIGKGCNYRYFAHLKEAEKILRFDESYDTRNRKINKILSILKKGKKPIIQIFKGGLSEQDAFDLEAKLISHFGIKGEGGILYNYESGGFGGYTVSTEAKKKMSDSAIGKIIKEETRVKISISNTGIKRPKTKQQIEKQRVSLKAIYNSGEFIPWNKGKTGIYVQSEESNRKRSDKMKGRKHSEEHNKHKSEAFKKQYASGERKSIERLLNQSGEKNHMFGKITYNAIKVIELDSNGNIFREFKSMKEASIQLNISQNVVKNLCNGKIGYKNFNLKFKN